MKRMIPIRCGHTGGFDQRVGAGSEGRGAPPPPPALEAGASQADVDKALLAAPAANLRDQATVVKWKPDFTYTTLRKGTNKLVCYDRSGFPGQQAFSIECTNLGNLDRVAQNMKFEAMGDKANRRCSMRRKKTEPVSSPSTGGAVPPDGR